MPSARVLIQTEQSCAFATAQKPGATAEGMESSIIPKTKDLPPSLHTAGDDFVLSSFKKQSKQYQELLKGLETIPLPLTGDDAAIKKYASDVESLRKKIGMPDVEQLYAAELEYKKACAGSDLRKFITSALDDVELGDLEGARAELLAAVDAAETQSGAPLSPANTKGWSVLSSKLVDIEKKYSLGNKQKVKDEAIFDMYKQHISSLKEKATEDMHKAIEGDAGLAGFTPNLESLKGAIKLT